MQWPVDDDWQENVLLGRTRLVAMLSVVRIHGEKYGHDPPVYMYAGAAFSRHYGYSSDFFLQKPKERTKENFANEKRKRNMKNEGVRQGSLPF